MAEYQWNPGSVAKQIANALSAMNDYAPVSHDQVIVEPTGFAGRYLITIYDSPQAANAIIPMLDEHGSIPLSFGEFIKCPIGLQTNRQMLTMDPRQHGTAIGGTTSGKSSQFRAMLLHILRYPNCFVWIGGTWKLYKFVSGLVDPFLNTEFPCPIDWIAHGHQDVANMMASWLDIGEYRMSLSEHELVGLPTGFLIMDEVTYIVKDKSVVGIRNGKPYKLDALLSDIVRGNAEADLWTWLATQHDTQFNLGDDGGTVGAQMMFKFIFAIGDYQSAGRVTNDFSLSLPTHPGECWVRPGLTMPLYKLRVPYPRKGQTDPVHNGPTMSEMVWARRHIPHKLDAGSANAAGEHYANRHGPMVDAAYINYLKTKPNNTASGTNGTSGSNGAISVGGMSFSKQDLADAEEQFYQMLRQESGLPPDMPANDSGQLVSEPNGQVAVQGKTRADRIIAVLQVRKDNGGEPMTRGEIIDELKEKFDDVVMNPRVVSNILGELVDADSPLIDRDAIGRYRYL